MFRDESSDSEIVPDTPLGSTPPKVSTLIISSLASPTTTIFSTVSIPLEIGVTKSFSEEVPISDFHTNISDTGVGVIMSVDNTNLVSEAIHLITSSIVSLTIDTS